MEFELQPVTEPGRQMVDLAEKHAADFATRAAEHDRDGTFAFENVVEMRNSGFVAAAVPRDLGGMGVTSVHDSIVAMSRLGRAEGSTPLAFTMHLFRTLGLVRGLQTATANGNQTRQTRLEGVLKKIGTGELVITVANSERGADIRTSRTTATRVEGGWLFNGNKTFATGSPAADLLAVRARYENEKGELRLGTTMAPVDRPGVEIMNNWDGLGMRASGSHDVVFTDYFVPEDEFDDIGEFGKFNSPLLALASGSSLGLASVFLGIAESANEIAVNSIMERGAANYPMNQATTAENEIDLTAMRGILSRAAHSIDEDARVNYAAGSVSSRDGMSEMEAFRIIKNSAVAKKFVMDHSGKIVDRAITLFGGGGFMNNSVLARLYRDVRAGPLMQPWASNQAIELIGKVALGLNPNKGQPK
ncbi:MAG: acyl-CoA/acyl-ACP dehydrogenase [Chloroflexi bacterium]|nr:acyl-CoA/acyl-ACP dehydrogenase [Chloroflexota bacterium]